ncbi:MAG TPA: glycyl-radical enzyme activating protein [Armatimonadetes bacterium]|nr:glycyl-radical enzyme activating protein [Armatimonadota bacterium]
MGCDEMEVNRCEGALVMGCIFDIKRFAIHDGPGIRTTVFLKGCPLQCLWCHNPESISPHREMLFTPERCIICGACENVCPTGAHRFEDNQHIYERERCVVCGRCADVCHARALEIVGRNVTVADVMSEVEQDIPFYETSDGGLTISGGEPLMQLKFTEALLRVAKQRGLHTCLDTSGYADWNAFERILPLVDLFLYDIKFINDDQHRKWTGVSNARILQNLRQLVNAGANVTLRCPIIPTINDSNEHFRDLAELINELNAPLKCELLPYHRMAVPKYKRLGREYPLADIEIPSNEIVHGWLEQLRAMGVDAVVG